LVISREGEILIYTKAVTRVSFLEWKVVWGRPRSPAGLGHSPGRGQGGKVPLELWLYLELQGYFGYENDRSTCN